MDWVSSAQNLNASWLGIGSFQDQALIKKLADPSPGNKELRTKIFEKFRNPDSQEQQQYKLPYTLGDDVNYSDSPLRWQRIPKQVYGYLRDWAEGKFVNDLTLDSASPAVGFEGIPLAGQPEALTRAALEPCSGGAFHPGLELTWPLRHKELYQGAFRIAVAKTRSPDLIQDLGRLLTPQVAFEGFHQTPGAIGPQMPGDLTRWMGLPWQCDVFSCQSVLFSNDFPQATWWPASLPIDVLTEKHYEAVMDPKLSPEERLKFFNQRMAWSRGVAGIGYHVNGSYTDGLSRMIYLWHQMGFIVKRPGSKDQDALKEIPREIYVEVGRGSMDLSEAIKPT